MMRLPSATLVVLLAALSLIVSGCGGGGSSGPPGAEPLSIDKNTGLPLAPIDDGDSATVAGEFVLPAAINNVNQVVGAAEITAGGILQAALWEVDPDGTSGVAPKSLAALVPGGFAAAFDLNESGSIVGSAIDAQGRTRAVLWVDADQPPVTLPGRGGQFAAAYSINETGRIVGVAENTDDILEAVWWQLGENAAVSGPSFFTAGPQGWEAAAYAVNAENHVAGELISPDGKSQAVLWHLDAGVYARIDLPMPAEGFDHTVALALNSPLSGEPLLVAGEMSDDGAGGESRGVRWTLSNGTVTQALNLETTSISSSAEAINTSGMIAGWRGTGPRATVWIETVPEALLTTESQAFGINDGNLVIGRSGPTGFVKRVP